MHRGRQAACCARSRWRRPPRPACTSSRPRWRPAAGSSRSGFMRRFDPAYGVKLRACRGAIGAPLLVHCAHRNAPAPATFTSEMLITSSCRARDRHHALAARRGDRGRHRARAALVQRRRATGLRDPQLSCSRPRAASWSTSRCSSTRATATTSAARSWARRARCGSASRSRRTSARASRPPTGASSTPGCSARPRGPSAWDGYAANAVADACIASLARRRARRGRAGRKARAVRLKSEPSRGVSQACYNLPRRVYHPS